MNKYLDLFLTFAKVGVCTFGGGYAMLPIMQRELAENKGWTTEEQLAEYRELTDHFVLIENWYFSGSGSTEIQQIIARYLDGELRSDQLLSALDQKLRMMQMEEGD